MREEGTAQEGAEEGMPRRAAHGRRRPRAAAAARGRRRAARGRPAGRGGGGARPPPPARGRPSAAGGRRRRRPGRAENEKMVEIGEIHQKWRNSPNYGGIHHFLVNLAKFGDFRPFW